MKKEGVQFKVLTFVITFMLLCSFSFSCFAASDHYDPELWQYNDSYVNGKSSEDKRLVFFPLAPESSHKDYMIVLWRDNYYLLLGDGSWLLFGRGYIENPRTFDMYVYSENSNNWEEVIDKTEFYDKDWKMYHFDRSMVVIDSTSNVEIWGISTPIDEHSYINYTGYRIYWTLSLILKMVLSRLQTVSDYVLSHELLRYAVMLGFAGEVLFFVIRLIVRIGDLKNEEASD